MLYEPKSKPGAAALPLDVGPLLADLARLDGVMVAPDQVDKINATPMGNIAFQVGQMLAFDASSGAIIVQAGPVLAGLLNSVRGKK